MKVKPEGHKLRYPKAYGDFGVLLILGAFFTCIITWNIYTVMEHPKNAMFAMAIIVLVGVVGALRVAACELVYCKLYAKGIFQRTLWKSCFIAWDDVEKVRYSYVHPSLVVYSRKGDEIAISRRMEGLDIFGRYVFDFVHPDALNERTREYLQYLIDKDDDLIIPLKTKRKALSLTSVEDDIMQADEAN